MGLASLRHQSDEFLREIHSRFESLTPAERQIVSFVAEGKADIEIAQIKQRTPHTVKSQMKSIRLKLGATTRTAVAVLAITIGGCTPALEELVEY